MLAYSNSLRSVSTTARSSSRCFATSLDLDSIVSPKGYEARTPPYAKLLKNLTPTRL